MCRFAGVVSHDSICIALMHAALLGLPVLGVDIRNAYLQPTSSENVLSCLLALRNTVDLSRVGASYQKVMKSKLWI
jgi:hypothetical protein